MKRNRYVIRETSSMGTPQFSLFLMQGKGGKWLGTFATRSAAENAKHQNKGTTVKTNPTTRKKPRTPAQRAATAKMLAANRARRRGALYTQLHIPQKKRVKRNPGRPLPPGATYAKPRPAERKHRYYVQIKPKSAGVKKVTIATFFEYKAAVEYARAYANAHNKSMIVDGPL